MPKEQSKKILEKLNATDSHQTVDKHVKDSSLHLAAIGGHMDIVKAMVGQVADINIGDDFARTALNDHKDIVGFLVEKDADVKAVDNEGRTALDLANEFGHTEGKMLY